MENLSLVPQPPYFQRGVNRTRLPGIHVACEFTDPALAATAVPPTAPADIGQSTIYPARAPSRAPNIGTEELDINSSAPASHRGCIGEGTDKVPTSTSSPEVTSRSDVADRDSQASLAQLQTASRRAKANRQARSVVRPARPQLSSASQARSV